MWWTLVVAGQAQAVEMAARDGDRIERGHPITFGLVGGLADATPDAWMDLQQADLAFVIAAGDTVPSGRARFYRRLHETLGALPVVPLPGPGEANRDADLWWFFRAYEGLGADGIGPVTWRRFDLLPRGAPWRLLVLDADAARLGDSFLDELIWVPKALPMTHPLLVVCNAPVGTLTAEASPSAGAWRLHELVRRHTEPTRMPLWAAADGAAGFVLPGGRWGEAWLGIGRISGPASTLLRVDPRLTSGRTRISGTPPLVVDAAFDAALTDHFAGLADTAALLVGQAYDAERFPVEGWWRITVDADELTATLRMRAIQGWTDVFTARWTRASGWTNPY